MIDNRPRIPIAARWLAAGLASIWIGQRSGAAGIGATATLAPWIVAAFAELQSMIVARGGRRPPTQSRTAHRLGLVTVTLGWVGATAIADPILDRVWIAAYALVLLHRAVVLLICARPVLGRRIPSRPSLVFFLLPLSFYFALAPWSVDQRHPNGDEPHYLLIAHSLAFDLDADLADNYANQDWRFFTDREVAPQPGDPVGSTGEIYSRHNLTLPLLMAPAYRLAGRTGAVTVIAVLTALLCWSTLRLARHAFSERPGEALIAYGLVALLAPTTIYATQIWVEVPAALLTVVSIDCALSLGGGSRRRSVAGLLVATGGLILLKLRFTLLALPIIALAAWRTPRARRWLGVAALTLAGLLAAVLAFNQLAFGHPLKIYRWLELSEPWRKAPVDTLDGLVGLAFDCTFGLLFVAPLWALLFAVLPAENGKRREWLAYSAVVFGLYVLFLIPRTSWFGGFSPPFRYGYVMLPALAVALIPVLAHRGRGGLRLALVALTGVTVVLTVTWIARPEWTYSLAHGRNHLLDHLSLRVGRDAARFFPSLVRPNLATLIWPLAIVAIVVGAGRWRRRIRPDKATGVAAAVALLALALLPPAASMTPSRRIELEDPTVAARQARRYPSRWQPQRVLYRGGLLLANGAQVTTPINPGGDSVRIALDLNFLVKEPERYTVEVSDGERLLGSCRGRDRKRWWRCELEAVAWPAEAVLRLRLVGPPNDNHRLVIVDRATLDWL